MKCLCNPAICACFTYRLHNAKQPEVLYMYMCRIDRTFTKPYDMNMCTHRLVEYMKCYVNLQYVPVFHIQTT